MYEKSSIPGAADTGLPLLSQGYRPRCPDPARFFPGATSRARDTCTYPRMYPYVSDTYHECILCVMYLRVKIHCILNVS